MAELNLEQIEDKLNAEFIGDSRKLIFWYDDHGEFKEDIESLELKNAKIHHLTPTNLFKTKMLLEREDTENNYLIYAPFPKPSSRENHLADTIKYSKEFFADRASLLAVDLGIADEYKPVLQKYIKFFEAKERTKRFYNLEVDRYNENTIEIALLSALAKSRVANFEEVVRIVLTSGDLIENEYLKEFGKYGLEEAFWRHCGNTFSYVDEDPNLSKLLISLYLTYTQNEIDSELPDAMNRYILNKPGTVMAFMDQLMNSVVYRNEFDVLSDEVYMRINGDELFADYSVEAIVDLDIFRFVDQRIIDWMIERLLDENLNATIHDMKIPKVCRYREAKHYGEEYYNEYHVLRHAYYVISHVNFEAKLDILSLIEEYETEDYMIDTHYRKFYYYLDQVEDRHLFDELRTLVENIYTNRYLDVILRQFNEKFSYGAVRRKYKFQRDFYRNFVDPVKEKLVVIISDGLRYEVAKELVKKLGRDEKVTAEIEPQIGVLPSNTRLGMASLLPHRQLTIGEDYDVYVDGKPCRNTEERNKILKIEDPHADSIQYKVLKHYNQEELRAFFAGKSVIYIYHNQIDDRGDQARTEDEVFMACAEAIDEISELIKKLTNNVSTTRYIITADHGFIYKRDKLVESDKIDRFATSDDQINRRYIVSNDSYEVTGTKSMAVSDILGGNDTKTVTFPLASNVFKVAGGGQNYVHGGSSPQEIIVPVVQAKTIRGAMETETVQIALISMLPKITSLILNLDFIQQEAISDVIKPTTYKIVFVDEAGEVISNEEMYIANSKEKESAKRIFRLRFNLRNQRYDRDKRYYLTITDMETGIETLRHEVIIDIAFADDFGFDI